MITPTAKKTRHDFDAFYREFLMTQKFLEASEELPWRAPEVSGWSLAEQIEHLLLTDLGILRLINERDPEILRQGRAKPRFLGRMVLLFGFWKRGVAKSPERVKPRDANPERLRELSSKTEQQFSELDAALDTVDLTRWMYPHPLLGDFSAQQWLRFNVVHHQHHHRIIEDIRKACLARAA